jgi:hypothetical protein
MSPVISADVPDDLAEQVEEEQGDDESRSAAVRRLVRSGLDAEQARGVTVDYPTLASFGGWFFVAAAFADTKPVFGYAGLAVVGLSLAYSLVQRRDWEV